MLRYIYIYISYKGAYLYLRSITLATTPWAFKVLYYLYLYM